MSRLVSDAREQGRDDGRKAGRGMARDSITVDTAKLQAHAQRLNAQADRAGALRARVLAQDGPLLYASEANGAGASLHTAALSLSGAQQGLRDSAIDSMGLAFAYISLERQYPKGKVPRSEWEGLLNSPGHRKRFRAEYEQARGFWRLMYGSNGPEHVEFAAFLNSGVSGYRATMEAMSAASFAMVMDVLNARGVSKGKIQLLLKTFPGLSRADAKNIVKLSNTKRGITSAEDLAAAVGDTRMRGAVFRAIADGRVLGRIPLPSQRVADLIGQAFARVKLPPGAMIPYVRTATGAVLAKAGGRAVVKQFASRLLVMATVSIDMKTLFDPSASATAKAAAGSSLVATAAVVGTGAATAAGVAAGSAWVPVAGWVVAAGATAVAIGLTIKEARDQARLEAQAATAYEKAYVKAAEKAYAERIAELQDQRITGATSASHRATMLQMNTTQYREYGTYVPHVSATRAG